MGMAYIYALVCASTELLSYRTSAKHPRNYIDYLTYLRVHFKIHPNS